MKTFPFLKHLKNPKILLGIILLLAAFLRLYNAEKWFDFAHDGDLYSWIFKDIVIDNHLRLIGQLTSTPGIYIGPFFYYSIIPFFFLTNLEPVGTVYYAVVLGLLTTFSFYFVFKKLFNEITGLIAAFFHGVLIQRVMNDRWVVPTITTSIWEVWFLFVIVMISRGNLNVFPILGFLIGAIWHINFSLVPALLAVPIAIFFSRKIPTVKNIIGGIIGFLIPSIPLLLFEIKHGFSQTQGLIDSFLVNQKGGTGVDKLIFVLYQISGNAYQLLFYPERGQTISDYLSQYIKITHFGVIGINLVTFALFVSFFLLILFFGIFLVRKKFLDKKLVIVLYTWLFGMVFFFTVSSKIISEYYFTNITMIILTLLILLTSYSYNLNKLTKKIAIIFLLIIGFRSVFFLTGQYNYNGLGYQERKAVVNFIKEDAIKNNYPCIAVSYIAEPGKDFGFRYLFYHSKLHVNHSDSGSPIYSIVVPWNIADGPGKISIGGYGIIPEGTIKTKEEIAYSCSGQDSNLTDPMFGFSQI